MNRLAVSRLPRVSRRTCTSRAGTWIGGIWLQFVHMDDAGPEVHVGMYDIPWQGFKQNFLLRQINSDPLQTMDL